MNKIILFPIKLPVVILYYIFIVTYIVVTLPMLILKPNNYKKVVGNLFSGNLIEPDPTWLSEMEVGDEYTITKSALDWLVGKEIKMVK